MPMEVVLFDSLSLYLEEDSLTAKQEREALASGKGQDFWDKRYFVREINIQSIGDPAR